MSIVELIPLSFALGGTVMGAFHIAHHALIGGLDRDHTENEREDNREEELLCAWERGELRS